MVTLETDAVFSRSSNSCDPSRQIEVISEEMFHIDPEKAIFCFDFDGTLVVSEIAHQLSFKAALRKIIEDQFHDHNSKNDLLVFFDAIDFQTAFGLGENGTAKTIIGIWNQAVGARYPDNSEFRFEEKHDGKQQISSEAIQQILQLRPRLFADKFINEVTPVRGFENLLPMLNSGRAVIVTGSAYSVVDATIRSEYLSQDHPTFANALHSVPKITSSNPETASSEGLIGRQSYVKPKPHEQPYSVGLVAVGRSITGSQELGFAVRDQIGNASTHIFLEDTAIGATAAIRRAMLTTFSPVGEKPSQLILVSPEGGLEGALGLKQELEKIYSAAYRRAANNRKDKITNMNLPKVIILAKDGWTQLRTSRSPFSDAVLAD